MKITCIKKPNYEEVYSGTNHYRRFENGEWFAIDGDISCDVSENLKRELEDAYNIFKDLPECEWS